MNTLAWFFFKLLIFEYIEDPGTGMAFRLPGGHSWKIFIEVLHAYRISWFGICVLIMLMQVPSLAEVSQEDVEQHLKWIQDGIPVFKLIGKPVLIGKTKLVYNCTYV